MIVISGRGESEDGGAEKHGFIVRMADQEDDAFVAQYRRRGERGGEYRGCHEPEEQESQNETGDVVNRHGV